MTALNTVRRASQYGAASAADSDDAADRFAVEPLYNQAVGSLSGGERQVVAIARAIAAKPEVPLLDEPFSALDPRTRGATRRQLRATYFERGFTVLQVTHDFAEVGVENVFAGTARPIRAEAPDFRDAAKDQFAELPVAFTTGGLTFYALGDVVPGPAHAVIRAEEVSLSVEPSMSSMQNQFRGRIVEIVPAGALSKVTVEASGTPIVAAVTARSVRELSLEVGREIVVGFKATAVHLC